MNNEIEKAVDTADKKAYEFRKLGALDVAPMCKIIGKIGITEFSKCFESESVLNLIKQMKGKDATQIQDIAGIVGVDTVYVHTDIQKVETDHNGKAVEDLFSYHEVQYSKDEYLDLMMKENAALKESITDTQIALCEIYESMGG